ncbi:MAG: GH92 family glycosyl hydrolase [Marinilabiliales bacterium]|nr:GH92 family glycosyl hydrolase [Marinilabiliales bacterium]
MKPFRSPVIVLTITMLLAISNRVTAKDPVDFVNPLIGSIGHLLTATTADVQLPHGMIRLYPQTTPGIRDNYLADKIYGFTLSSMSADFSVNGFCLTALTGTPAADPAANASLFDHDQEKATPYSYSVLQMDNDIRSSMTATDHGACYQFQYPAGKEATLLLVVNQQAEIHISGDRVIEGYQHTGRTPDSRRKLYFHLELSRPFRSVGSWSNKGVTPGERSVEGTGLGLYGKVGDTAGTPLTVKAGFSFIGPEQAIENFDREVATQSFEQLSAAARKTWNDALGRVILNGGSLADRTIFYTALYRAYGRKTTNISEYGRYYSGFDDQVHPTEGHDFYQMGESWGSFRSLFPLGMLLEPERQNDIIRSYLRMYDQTGYLGDAAHRQRVMIGRHEAGTIADAWSKGFHDFDLKKAYEGMRKNATAVTMIPWQNGPATSLDSIYYQKGFFPALPPGAKERVGLAAGFEKRQAVSVTLEHAYDDWCVAQVAKILGNTADFQYFTERAGNYRNVWDERIGFMAPKTADGAWVFGDKPLDPIWSGGQGGRDYYTETNAWTYTFQVMHDIPGLIRLMGGKAPFADKLDRLFQEQFGGKGLKFTFLNQFPDGTGLIGQFNMGNQPGFHIPYLYNFTDEPWKTQRRVREILKVWFTDGPLGICGDEDEGEISSWYLFSALGFYPVCPGNPVYAIGSPLFPVATLRTAPGKSFTVRAVGVSDLNKYIQSARLNGKPLLRPWLAHADLVAGGTLELQMGPTPNKQWGRE